MAKEPYYLEREVDSTLGERAREWLISQNGSAWLSLLSQPGRGNTNLLRHFTIMGRNRGPYKYTIGELRVLNVDASRATEGREPSALPPVAKALFNARTSGRRSTLTKLFWRFSWLAAFCLAVPLTIALMVLEHLIRESKYELFDPELWRQVLLDARSSLPRFIVVLVIGVTVMLLIHWIMQVVLHGLPRVGYGRRAHEQEKNDFEQRHLAAMRRYGAEFLEELKAFCKPSPRGIILLVDSADKLPPKDRLILEELFEPSEEDTPLGRFARSQRIFIVTVDYERDRWSFSTSSEEIPAFTELELWTIYQQRDPGKRREEFEKVKDQAFKNIAFLFDPQPSAREVVREFNEKRNRSGRTEFGLHHLMAYWAARNLSSIDKTEFKLSLKKILPHLHEFGLAASTTVNRLTKSFAKLKIVEAEEERFYFDSVAVAALLHALRQKDPTYWLKHIFCGPSR